MKLTESQQAAVTQRGTNLLVAASAGSGKTEVLARRCVSLIADASQPCDIDRLLVVTFTRAAAAELRARVGKMLRAHRDETRDPSLRAHLRRQEVLVDTAEIGTIDAWCARVVREHFAATRGGVDPAFSVLGAEEAVLLRSEAVNELFEWVYAAEDELAAGARDWILRHAKPSDDFLRGLVRELNSYREHLINPEQWFAAQREFYGRDEELIRADTQRLLAEVLAAECAFQREQLEEVIAAVESDIVRGQLAEYGAALEAWTSRLDAGSDVAEMAGEIAAFRFPRKPREMSLADAGLREEVKERWFDRRLKKRWSADWIAEVRAHAGGSARLIVTLLRLEERYRRLLDDRKRGRGAYEFGDVLRTALDLLGTPAAGQTREPTPIARALQRRYEHILIDEYQDTSPVQVELLRLVSRCEAGRSNRFMVGDIKQSIYGFREAEPRLFGDLIDAFASGGEDGRVLPLSDNFRSHADLVDGLNRLFARLFDPALGGTGYGDEEQLRAQREDVANPTLDAEPRIELQLVFEDTRGGGPSDDTDEAGDTIPLERIEREARVAADRIHALLDARAQIPERGADGMVALRPLRLADIVVLLRSAKGNAPLLAGVLRAAGIPCVAAGRESVLDSLEVHDVRNALALVVNRKQDVPLASYLRGPLVGLSAAELFEVRRASLKSGLHEAVEAYRDAGSDRALAVRLDGALAQIDAWTRAARIQELPMLLRQILRDSGQVFFARALPGGEHRVAMVRALEALAADFAANQGGGVAEFVRHLEALVEQEVEPVATAAVGEDIVRIMTIHAAKGLEFPVVFLLGTGTAFSRRPQRGSLCCDERRGIGLEFFDYPARVKLVSAPYAVNRMARTQRELEEELRLLYVAATRARERLVIVGHTGDEVWESLRERYVEADGALPLISRLAAASMLEWAMMGVAAGRLALPLGGGRPAVRVETHAGERPAPTKTDDGDGGAASYEGELSPDDRRWVERGRAWIETVLDTSLAQQPAVLSVSAVKRQALGADDEDVPRDFEFPSPLREPAFARTTGGADGRAIGNAYHRFMQLADLRRLSRVDDVRTQIDELLARQRLTEAEAELLAADDAVWFAGTDAGQMLARRPEACRREVPFVYALPIAAGAERTVLRGVIDCLVETDDGLVILDYKTDRPRDEADRAQRIAGYTIQLQLYALAAKEVFGRGVTSAVLVFLRERRLEPVAVESLSAAQMFASFGG